MNGFLVVDKPSGMTSHDVIARLRRVLGVRRVGHAGTLDPSATGVLVVGVGRGARLLRFVETGEKEYRAEILFGVTTTTLDADGEVLIERDARALDAEVVGRALASFVGEIDQIPPMVSAIKVGGEPLYRKARRGEEIERAPRRVVVHEAVCEDFVPGERARAVVRVRCSKGTYIRVLAADLGDAVGTGASLTGLRRIRVGPFGIAEAIPLQDIEPGSVRTMEVAVSEYPRRAVGAEEARAFARGIPLPAAGISGPYSVWGPDGLVAMAEEKGAVARSLCVLTEE